MVTSGMWWPQIFHHSLQARELQTLHNLRKLFVQDVTTRVKKVSAAPGVFPAPISLSCPQVSPAPVAFSGASGARSEWGLTGLRMVRFFPALSLLRVQKWSPRTVGDSLPKAEDFPFFLRTTWNSLQRFTNR